MVDKYREPIDDSVDLRAKFVGGESKPITKTKTTTVERKEGAQIEREGAYAAVLSRMQNDDSDDSNQHAHTVARDARTGASHKDVKNQVEHLIKLAKTKGAVHAVKVAQHMSDYYILDAVHDKMLADQFFKDLNKEGLL